MIFDETDINLLKAFTGKHTYWNFAGTANSIIAPKFKKMMIERWGEEYYEKNKVAFEFVLNGSVATLYFDLLNFDREKFIRNMNYITNIAGELFSFER